MSSGYFILGVEAYLCALSCYCANLVSVAGFHGEQLVWLSLFCSQVFLFFPVGNDGLAAARLYCLDSSEMPNMHK